MTDPTGPQRGSAAIGWIFMASVFGPMLLVALLWMMSAGLGVDGGDVRSARDRVGDLMVMALMASGLLLALEGAVAGLLALLRGQRID